MDNKDILSAAQSEKSSMGEYEKEISKKSFSISGVVCVELCIALCLIDLFVKKYFDFGKPLMLLTYGSVMYCFEGKKLKDRKRKIRGIIYCVLTASCLLMYIGALFI